MSAIRDNNKVIYDNIKLGETIVASVLNIELSKESKV
jgi:hypothetical protein